MSIQIFAYLSLVAGIALALYALFVSTDTGGNLTTGVIMAAAYFVSGLSGFALFGGLAEILNRLQRLESGKEQVERSGKATYLPGWEPD